jgi:hypothetical protein
MKISENLQWVIRTYGFTCPKNNWLTYADFRDAICKVFCMTVDRNRAAINILCDQKQFKYRFSYDGTAEVKNDQSRT